MSPPTTLAKVRAALKRFVPSIAGWLSDTSKLGRERDSIGLALAMANDAVESIFAESFPDTASALLERWEKVTRVPSRPNESTAARQARVLAVLRRVNGPQLARLAASLASLLAVDAASVVFLESLRSQIDAGLTATTGTISNALAAGAPRVYAFPQAWPGVVDDYGVKVFATLTGYSGSGVTVTVTAPDGTTWSVPFNASGVWFETRSVFVGKPASGAQPWKVTITSAAGGQTITEVRLLVSNDIDAGQIYNFYVIRDPGLPGLADLAEAQRVFTRYSHAHNDSIVAERFAVKVDDGDSLVERDPVGV